MTTPEMISAIKDILLAAAAVITGIVAVLGLKNWQRELRGKIEFEAARNLMKATYRVRDELQKSRSPFVSAGEFPSDYPGPQDSTAEQEVKSWTHVYENRWAPVRQALQDLDIHVIEAEALWGNDIRVKTDYLKHCANEVWTAMHSFIDNKAHCGENFRSDREFAKEVKNDLYDDRNISNPLSNKIKAAVSAIEDVSRPHLHRR